MIKSALPIIGVALTTITVQAQTQDVSAELQGRFLGRIGAYLEDKREDEFAQSTPSSPGPRIGCHGDTLSAVVAIENVDVSTHENSATIVAAYRGQYSRQTWIAPCVASPSRDDANVYGTITVYMTQVPFKTPEVKWGAVENVGQIADPDHESNRIAAEAARRALSTAF